MLLSFKDLRSIIVKCCSADKSSDDISSCFGFSIDMAKMENMLKQKKNYLHVIGFSRVLQSRIPCFNDFQMISEYVYGDHMNTMLNGNSQICSFMIFSKATRDGIADLYNDGKNYSDKQIFDICNNHVNLNAVACILNNYPVYRVIVAKVFDPQNEKFEYKVYIRSNYQMVDYYNFLKENPDFIDNLIAEEEQYQEEKKSAQEETDEAVTEENDSVYSCQDEESVEDTGEDNEAE